MMVMMILGPYRCLLADTEIFDCDREDDPLSLPRQLDLLVEFGRIMT